MVMFFTFLFCMVIIFVICFAIGAGMADKKEDKQILFSDDEVETLVGLVDYSARTVLISDASIVGLKYHPGQHILRVTDEPDIALKREPENKHDPLAIAAYIKTGKKALKLGYVQAHLAALINERYENDGPLWAEVLQKDLDFLHLDVDIIGDPGCFRNPD